MVKVITYGTFDMLHHGHVRLLERAKALGDYLIVGVTSDDFDISRGKINNQQSLIERIKAVEETGLADEIIVEEYEGQKIDDIKKYDVDILAVGDDWKGKFDYLGNYCKLIYLPRTQGISSTEIRSSARHLRIKFDGLKYLSDKYESESQYVNGVETAKDEYDAIFTCADPEKRAEIVKENLNNKKHVLCDAPVALTVKEHKDLIKLAEKNELILSTGIKTAYSTAFNRLLVVLKSGRIGDVVSVEATCTSIRPLEHETTKWNSICDWGPIALLPIFEILGVKYKSCSIVSSLVNGRKNYDGFTKIDFVYEGAVATAKIGKSAKSEGDLIISGTKGYIYVPAPWWKTDYFEIRYEDPHKNKKYFYQLDGEGIRNELVAFSKSIEFKKDLLKVSNEVSLAITGVVEKFYKGEFTKIKSTSIE